MDAIDYLIKHRVLISRDIDKPFQMNLTRDGNIKSVKDILLAMEEYAEQQQEHTENLRDYSA